LPRTGSGSASSASIAARWFPCGMIKPIRPSAIATRWRFSLLPGATIRSIAAKIVAAAGAAAVAASARRCSRRAATVEKSGQAFSGEAAGVF
jgi:hypothetical protein